MKTLSPILFFICLNLAAFILQQSEVFPISRELYVSPADIESQFNLTIFGALAAGGSIIGIAALLTRQYVYAAGALLLWVAGILLPITQWLLIGTPLVLGALLPAELWYISDAVAAGFAVLLFIFMLEFVSQRQIT